MHRKCIQGHVKTFLFFSGLGLLGIWGAISYKSWGSHNQFGILAQCNCFPGQKRIVATDYIIIHRNTFLCLKNIFKIYIYWPEMALRTNYYFVKDQKTFECSDKILANLICLGWDWTRMIFFCGIGIELEWSLSCSSRMGALFHSLTVPSAPPLAELAPLNIALSWEGT